MHGVPDLCEKVFGPLSLSPPTALCAKAAVGQQGGRGHWLVFRIDWTLKWVSSKALYGHIPQYEPWTMAQFHRAENNRKDLHNASR